MSKRKGARTRKVRVPLDFSFATGSARHNAELAFRVLKRAAAYREANLRDNAFEALSFDTRSTALTYSEVISRPRANLESIRPQLAVLVHDKHPRTSDPLGNPREMTEPDSLGG